MWMNIPLMSLSGGRVLEFNVALLIQIMTRIIMTSYLIELEILQTRRG